MPAFLPPSALQPRRRPCPLVSAPPQLSSIRKTPTALAKPVRRHSGDPLATKQSPHPRRARTSPRTPPPPAGLTLIAEDLARVRRFLSHLLSATVASEVVENNGETPTHTPATSHVDSSPVTTPPTHTSSSTPTSTVISPASHLARARASRRARRARSATGTAFATRFSVARGALDRFARGVAQRAASVLQLAATLTRHALPSGSSGWLPLASLSWQIGPLETLSTRRRARRATLRAAAIRADTMAVVLATTQAIGVTVQSARDAFKPVAKLAVRKLGEFPGVTTLSKRVTGVGVLVGVVAVTSGALTMATVSTAVSATAVAVAGGAIVRARLAQTAVLPPAGDTGLPRSQAAQKVREVVVGSVRAGRGHGRRQVGRGEDGLSDMVHTAASATVAVAAAAAAVAAGGKKLAEPLLVRGGRVDKWSTAAVTVPKQKVDMAKGATGRKGAVGQRRARADEESVETEAYTVGETVPRVMGLPVVGVVLSVLDAVMYEVERVGGRVVRRVGVKRQGGEWSLLGTLQRAQTE